MLPQITWNESIEPENLIELNQQKVNRVYLETFAVGIESLSNEQLSIIDSIAVQCPQIGGRAVYQARAIIEYALDTVINYDNACNQPVKVFGPDTLSVPPYPYAVCPEGTYDFSIDAIDGISSYRWFTTIEDATLTPSGTSCSVEFPASIPENAQVCVVAIDSNGVEGLPSCISVESGVPKFPDIGDTVSVCCGDTLLFTFPDSTIQEIQVTMVGMLDSPDEYNNVAYIYVDTLGEYYSSQHTTITDCDNEIYIDVDVAVSVNPTYMRIIVCGNIDQATLVVSARNICGSAERWFRVSDTCYNGDSCEVYSPRLAYLDIKKGQSSFEIIPNPNPGIFAIRLNSSEEGPYTIVLTDMLGKVLTEKETSAVKGLNDYMFNLSHLQKGIYYIKLKSANEELIEKLLIEY